MTFSQNDYKSALRAGTEAWTTWRNQYHLIPDCRGLNLSGTKLRGADLRDLDFSHCDLSACDWSGANLSLAKLKSAKAAGSNFSKTQFGGADLSDAILLDSHFGLAEFRSARLLRANLHGADLRGAFLTDANLSEACLHSTNLSEAVFHQTDLTNATICDANLMRSVMVATTLNGANITNCKIYGLAAWSLKIDENTKQENLLITDESETAITTDGLEFAQFLHLLITSRKIRSAIDTITSKVVLILGRFGLGHLTLLQALREELKKSDLIPIIFDFEQPNSRDTTETVATLAHLAKFVIADLTHPASIPQELQRIVPTLPSLPIITLLQEGQSPWSMWNDFRRYPWVREPILYQDQQDLIGKLESQVIQQALDACESNKPKKPDSE